MSNLATKLSSEPLVAPRAVRGVDYGVPGKVLARHGSNLLVWRAGHSFWGGSLTPHDYMPATLRVEHARNSRGSDSTDVFEGGRLSGKRLVEHAQKIADLMGIGVEDVASINGKVTVTFEEA